MAAVSSKGVNQSRPDLWARSAVNVQAIGQPRTAHSRTLAALAGAPALPTAALAPATSTRTRSSRTEGALLRDDELDRHRIQVEDVTDERSQGNDELGGLHHPPCDKVGRSPGRQAHLFLGAQQDDV
jgi:hypothetical protein